MANDKLIFPIGFDLEAGVNEAVKNIGATLIRIERRIKDKPLELKISGLSELDQRIKALTESLARLNTVFAATANMQQQLTNSTQEQGRITANTSNTISRQLMEQERVNKALRDVYSEQERVNQLLDNYHDTYDGQVESLIRLNNALEANKQAQKDNEKALKGRSITSAEFYERQKELTAQYRQLTQEKRTLNQIMTAEEKAMLTQEGSYVQLSQQLSLLKKAYKELGEEGRTSPFGQDLEGAIQNLDAHLKDMAADMGEFQRNVGNYAIAGQNGVVTTESLTAAINQEARTTQDLIDQTRILEEAKRMLNTSDANYTSTLDAINAKLEENKRKLSDVSDILGKDAKSVAEAEAQNKRLSEALKHVDLTSADAKKSLEEIRMQIERNNATIAAATGANERYADSMLGLVGINANFGSSLQSLGQGGSFIDGLKTKVQAFGKTLIGLLSNPMVLGFLGIAGVVAGFKWWYDYNKGLIEASRLTENFTGLSGEAADRITADMQTLADHMGQGYDKTISAANTLVQQFGVSWEDAMKLMQDGIVAGADMSGNMVSNIERFAPALRDAGVSADEFMSILAETRNGIFNEQGIQLIVRAGGKLKAMTKQTAESLDAAGISSKQLQKDLSNGTITMFDAVQKVATKLKELPENSQEAGNIMKHVFGRTAAEGGTLLIQSIADVNTNLDEAKNRMGELGKANEEQMNAQRELNEALLAVFKVSGTNFEIMIAKAKTFAAQGLTKVIKGCVDIVNWFIRMYNKSIVVRGAVNSIANSFNTLWEIAKFVLNQTVDAFAATGTLIEGIVTLDWDKIKQGWSDGMNALGKNVTTLAKNIASNTANAFNRMIKDEMKEVSIDLNADGTSSTTIKKGGSGTTDKILPIGKADKEAAKSYLQTLNKIEQSLSTIYAKYTDLEKKEGATKALGHINELYKTQLAYINELGEQFSLSFKMPTAFKDLQSYRSAILGVINKLKASGIKGAENAALDFEMKIGLGNIDDAQKKIEKQIKQLADRISRTKTAKEFYEKILGQTGDVELAANLSLSIYGENGEDLDKAIRDNIQATLGKNKQGVDLDFSAAIRTDGSVDYNALTKIAKGYLDMGEISEDTYNKILKMRDEDRKDLAKTVEGWLKATEKAKTYSDKLLDLRRKTQAEIDSINEKERHGDITPEFAESQRAGFLRKEAEEVAKLQYEAFKDSPMYVQMFDDLDNASTTMLRNMKQRIEELKTSWKDLTPTQLKEMQSRLNEIDAQLAKRNPFKGIIDGIKEYRNLRKGGDALGNKSEGAAEKALDTAAKARLEAEKEYLEILNKEGATQEEIAKAKERFDRAAADEDAAAKALENWKKVKDAIGLSANELFQMLNWAGDIAKGIADISEAMGADEEDVQYWNDVASALSEVAGGIQDIVQAAMSGNVVGIVSSVLTAIPKMFVGFANLFSAGKIKNANKEIKRQGELLEGLEYSYGRLQKAAEKLFGGEYISNFNKQLANLRAQAEAYRKQAEAEQGKGKKADKEKVKEYQQSQRDTLDAIADMQDELTAHFTGSTRADIARQMAESWIEARSSLSDTFAAIGDDYKEMIKKMVVEGAAARVIENALAPMWKQMDELLASGKTDAAIDKLISSMDTVVANANDGMEVLWQALEARGYDMKKLLGDSDTNLRGIERQIATASEEQVSDLATGIRTQNFYIGQQLEEVRAIRQMLASGSGQLTAGNGGGSVDVRAMQEQALNHLAMIERYTGETAARCERAAIACEEQVTMMRRVIVPKGTNGSHGVQVYMQ